jgi:hypothetical protein
MPEFDPLEPMMHSVLTGKRRWHVEHGNSLYALRCLPDCCIDSMVTDPPAAIGFLGADWDKDRGGRRKWIRWLRKIMKQAFRVLKPGAHALIWALPKTAHWTTTAVEDAGFTVRDRIVHLFGQGMPKNADASKAIDRHNGDSANRVVTSTYRAGGNAGTSTADKRGTYAVGVANSEAVELKRTIGATEESRQWDGWGTALRPAAEDWILVRKPLEGTLAENLLKWGTGAINIDVNRIPRNYADEPDRPESWRKSAHSAKPGAEKIAAPPGIGINLHPLGGWPANAIFSHGPSCTESACTIECPLIELSEQSGILKSGKMRSGTPRPRREGVFGEMVGASSEGDTFGDTGTASRFFNCIHWNDSVDGWIPFHYTAKPSTKERELGCDALPLKSASELVGRKEGTTGIRDGRAGAGRASSGRHNNHPTLKRIELMRLLCRLVTPPGGVILDIFTGSGSTGCGAMVDGFRFIGVEINDSDAMPFVTIARARIDRVVNGGYRKLQTTAKAPPVDARQVSLFGDLA